MAVSTTSEFTETIYAAIIEQGIKAELGAAVVMAPLMRFHDLSGEASGAWSVPVFANIDASVTGTMATPLGETTDLSSTTLNPTAVTITAGEAGIRGDLSDQLLRRSVMQEALAAEVATYLGRAVARRIEQEIGVLFNSVTATAGAGTTDFAPIDVLFAMYTLENANAFGPTAAVLAPGQAHDFRRQLSYVAGATNSSQASVFSTTTPDSIGKLSVGNGGLWTTLFNVPFYVSSKAPTSGTDLHGCMFVSGSGLGMAAKTLNMVEFQRDASARTTEIVVTADYGVGIVVQGECVRLISDSTIT